MLMLVGVILIMSVIYAGLIFSFLVGWISGLGHASSKLNAQRSVLSLSIVVAARNESSVISVLLEALRHQDYPADLFEVIIVDDHSDDDTFDIVSRFIDKHRLAHFRLLSAHHRGSIPGKKHALDLGIRDARGEIILCTDADCLPGKGWLRAMADPFANKELHMVLGPVMLTSGHVGKLSAVRRIFLQMQQLEFLSLMGVTGGAAGIGRPIMANGANMAFRKKTFVELDGFAGNTQYVSGDDMFLLHKFKKFKLSGIKPGKISDARITFCNDKDALIETAASASLVAFFRQRGRWTGKASGYTDTFTLLTAGVVVLMNLMLAASLGLAFLYIMHAAIQGAPAFVCPIVTYFPLVKAFGVAWVIKALADFSLLWPVTHFFGQRQLLWLFPAVFLLYPLYVCGTIIAALLRKNSW